MAETKPSLEELLVARGLLTSEQLQTAQRRATQEGSPLEAVIREERLVFPEALAQVRAEVLGVPYIDLVSVKRNPEAMRDISRQAAATYRFFAFDERDRKLLVAMEAPDDFQALQAVRFIARKRGLELELYLGSQEGIDKVLGMTAEIQAEIGGALKEFSRELESAAVKGKKEQEIEQYIEEAPISKVVAVIIRHALEGNASDIHIEPNEKELRVRYRIDGDLHTSLLLPLKMHSAVISRIKILSNLKIDETRLPQDGRFSSATEGHAFDFRVATMPTAFGEKVVLRILDKSGGAPSFDELGLWGVHQEIYKQHVQAPHGMILISGPTGSGKSTTLFSTLTLLNTPSVNIVTLEDPIEYEVEGVNQTHVHPEIGLTFASGLRNMLRQDPDIIMVGEIRDRDTAELAIHASLTGHLVLSTIHTNDAIGAVPRLIDMGIDPFLLTASLRLLVAQRLVVRLCQQCKREVKLSATLKSKITAELESVPDSYKTEPNLQHPEVIFESPGCPACHEGAALGRLAIFEVVPVSKALRAAMSEAAPYDTLTEIARRDGHLTMRQDGLLKALAGHVQYEDVMRVTAEEDSFEPLNV
jgi:type IV pilus assembly protein PilB